MGSAISVRREEGKKYAIQARKKIFEGIWKKTKVRRSDSNRGPLAPKSDALTTWPQDNHEK